MSRKPPASRDGFNARSARRFDRQTSVSRFFGRIPAEKDVPPKDKPSKDGPSKDGPEKSGSSDPSSLLKGGLRNVFSTIRPLPDVQPRASWKPSAPYRDGGVISNIEPPVAGEAATLASGLKAAVHLLSQSTTGNDLLVRLHKAGYKLVFDAKTVDARQASGLCDTAARLIVLRPQADLNALALTIAHEAVHALQEADSSLLPSARLRPDVMIRMAFAIEADAYAQQVQVAFELADTAGGKQAVSHDPLRLMRERFPDLTKAASRTAREEGAVNDGRVVASAFNAFYDSFYLRSYYEKAHLDWMESFAARQSEKTKRPASALARYFTQDVSSADIKRDLTWRGVSYLTKHRPDIDFATPRYSGISRPSLERLAVFYAKHLPARRKPEAPSFGLYVIVNEKAKPKAAGSDKAPRKPQAPRNRKRDFW